MQNLRVHVEAGAHARPDRSRTEGRVLRLPTGSVLYLCTQVDFSTIGDPGCVEDFVDLGEI